MVKQVTLLDVTRATNFVPGTNVKGEVAGANWMFLLPSLELERVLCIGTPRQSAITMLAQVSRQVVIVASEAKKYSQANVEVAQVSSLDQLTASGAPFDLVFIAVPEQAQGFARGASLEAALQRLTASHTRFYWEELPRLARVTPLKAASGTSRAFWLTPLHGEAVTAVPLDDRQTAAYFLERGLFSPSVQKKLFAPLRRRLFKGGASAASRGGGSAPGKGGRKLRSRLKRRFGKIARSTGVTVLSRFETAERTLQQRSTLFTRRGVLTSPGSEAQHISAPPAYLCQLARQDGLEIAGHRWGLVASGEYSSRKVLCFLFAQHAAAPEYIVKIVRNPRFNARLENEARALLLLNQNGRLDAETLPRVVFSGHHAQLAMVGESCVEGQPFQQRSAYTADCPYGRRAIEWITQLGALNGASETIPAQEVADVLEALFTRFKAIYPLSESEAAFLQAQLDTVRGFGGELPAVFQHGDPGTWNMLVQDNGKIAVLDWEAAEPTGLPLWDMLYFLRSYVAGAAKKEGIADRLQAFRQHFLEDRGLNRFIAQAIHHYVAQVGVPAALIQPLFYSCWMHRSLKESTLLASENLATGYYFNVLRLCIRQHDQPVLQRLFGSPPNV